MPNFLRSSGIGVYGAGREAYFGVDGEDPGKYHLANQRIRRFSFDHGSMVTEFARRPGRKGRRVTKCWRLRPIGIRMERSVCAWPGR